MAQGFIRTRTLPHPDGDVDLFQIVLLIGGREHLSSEGWETHRTYEAAAQEAARRGIELDD